MFFRIIDIVRQFMQKSSPEVMQLRLDVEKRFGFAYVPLQILICYLWKYGIRRMTIFHPPL